MNDRIDPSSPTNAREPGGAQVYWRRELPPLSEAIEGEHTVEADSRHVPIDSHHELLWDTGSAELQAEVTRRIEQEIQRLGGSCAHVVEEQIEPKVDYSTGKMWLHGRFTYVLYHH